MKRAIGLAVFLVFAVAAPSASASEFGIAPGSFVVRALDAEGNPETRAGSHPDQLQIDFGLNVEGTSIRDFALEMPPGFGGASGSVPKCPRERFEKGEEECPAESQVGTFTLELGASGEETLPIFQLEPKPGELVAFGSIPSSETALTMELRPDDLGITFEASNLPEAAVSGGKIDLWGVPADHQVGTSIPRRPLLTMPTRCGSLSFGLRVRSREPDAPWLSASAAAPLDGCEKLAFEPKLSTQLGNPRADSPTGVQIALTMPESNDPDGLVGAQIKSATIELPEGVTVSPGGAAGITACSDAQLKLGESTPASCPPSSRVGTMELASPLTETPLSGDVYVGEERPGERLRMFIVGSGPGGVVVKSISTMHIDRATGRLSSVLTDLPQVPLTRLTLSIGGGPNALLASPLTCGSFPAVATLESYAGGAPVKAPSPVTIGAEADGSPCRYPAPFSPRLVTTSSAHLAGGPTEISMSLVRGPGEQLTKRFAMSLPKGLSANLGKIETCSDAAVASGACPPGSKIGEVVAKAGSGFDPVALRGDVYSAGAYRGAPVSMAMMLHAPPGPFDLGTTTTRSAMQFNPHNGRVTVVSDPLPALVEGIPVRIQSIGISLDRPGALRNPTSCAPVSFDATVEAATGASATATSALPVNGCKRLRLKPRITMDLSGRSELHEHGKPDFQVTTRMRPGDTNLRSLRMAMPSALTFGIGGLGEICPLGDARDGLCSPKARVGTTVARTSLLDKPLRGSIYVVQPQGDGMPDLGIVMAAKGLHVALRGRVSVRNGRMETDLSGLPDMPLSEFTLRLRGGKHGALSLRTAPCAHGREHPLTSRFYAKGQNGVSLERRLTVGVDCGKAGAGAAASRARPAAATR